MERIERASASDVPDVLAHLAQLNLPLDGVEAHLDRLVIARDDGRLVGTAALESYADGVLLRSVAVSPSHQGRQLGHRLTDAALRMAADAGAPAVYLLTTTAERFFPRFGFEPIAREEVPASVRESVEFRAACPASAVVMRKTLR